LSKITRTQHFVNITLSILYTKRLYKFALTFSLPIIHLNKITYKYVVDVAKKDKKLYYIVGIKIRI